MPRQQNLHASSATGLPGILAHLREGGTAHHWIAPRPEAAPAPVSLPRSPRPPAGLAPWQQRRIRLHVEAHLDGTLNLEGAARLVGLSRSHFSRCFRASFGDSFIGFVLARRVALAGRMMLEDAQALSQVAIACGFADQSHFSRVFGRLTGQTPTAWRRARARGPGMEA